jgi:membrane protein DedA with SNARE-associated domain
VESELLSAMTVPGLAYAVILVLLTFDAFVPIVPTQALMIGGGILSASGNLQLGLVVAAGVAGAFAGDVACFGVGRRLARRESKPPSGRFARVHKLTGKLTGAMQKHIFLAMLFCRFLPAGRMVASAHAGRSGYALRRFLAFDLIAVTLWASYGALLGHFGGEALERSSWLPLTIVAVAAALLIGAGPLLALAGRLRTGRTGEPSGGAAASQPAGAALADVDDVDDAALVAPEAALAAMLAEASSGHVLAA